ncbi:MAG: SLBB domain-containing protein [Bacteroidetes bacterium]|nr:SLBB domain-containing protein [Bacteroidota bacterium]
MYKFFKILFVLLLLLGGTELLQAQDLLKGKDLSQLRVDQLSDADVAKLKAQLASSGMTIDQAEQTALAKGMSAAEFTKLKQRLETGAGINKDGSGKLKTDKNSAEKKDNSSDSLNTGKYNEQSPKTLVDPLIFGSELYTSLSPSFEPNMKLATPLNYVLGPDDQIIVSVYGVQQYEGDLLVSAEGFVNIPNVGQVKVAGLTIEAATQKIKIVMGNTVYGYLKSGGAKLSVTLSKIRSIKVLIIGANRPGNYTLSSLSTVFNALYVAGGPTAFGSFREIELIRDNKLLRKIDLYRLLLHGDQSDNIGLKDNDVIRIPAYQTRVELRGQVKRPGYFEVLLGEDFQQILAFASGFTDTAYRKSVKLFQRNEKERKLVDLEATAYNSYHPQAGDVFVVSKILNRFENRVSISGSVFRPDVYSLSQGLKVADLIRKADGLKEDAYVGRGQVLRLEEDLTRSMVSFDIKKALANDPLHNLLLQREDEVLISSILDLRDPFKVTIQGEVRLPGQYEYVENLSLKDLILQAGGFTDAAFKKIEIARLIKRDSIAVTDNRASTIINTEIAGDLSSSVANMILQPYDVITIRRKAGYTIPETVVVVGQVQYPGPYVLNNRNERVSDILRRAGGYTPDAYPEGAYLRRYRNEEEKAKSKDVARKAGKNINDTSAAAKKMLVEDIIREYDQIPLDIPSILSSPGSIEDLIVRAKDELMIPKFDGQVKISGAVLMTTQVPYQQKNRLKNYISDAGGFSGDAWRKKTYVVYANGKAATTKHFLFFKFYPRIMPGCELIIPKKIEKKRMTTGEIIGISSALASLAGVAIAILRL